MILFLIVAFALAMAFSVTFRVMVTHPIATVLNCIRDTVLYIIHRKWNVYETGRIICYMGLFGKGKTLSAVHYVCGVYRTYNNKKVYDDIRKKWVVQKVHVISNVDLAIPYERFTSLAQIVSISERYHKIDEKDGTLTVHIVLGDEFSVQLNSRNFKSNIDPLFLNTLLTCRHHHISLVYTAQRFGHVDALLRQVTSYVISCNKLWRVMVHTRYDAYELENANNPLMVKPINRYGWFIRNRDFKAYDTLACVDNLKKSCLEGDMLSESEILALQQNTPTDMESVAKPSRKFMKLQRRRLKK